MDLSKAFDCIPHDLIIAKLIAYGLNENLVKYVYSYLQNRTQCVRINNVCSEFKQVLSGVPHGSIVGPLLFNVFINDFFFFINNSLVHNFAYDNTLTVFGKSSDNVLDQLQTESNIAVDWFNFNKMFANPDSKQF